jgi:2-amino-4-hydroxy-6-hydroxymethyldihydropteridine diphosphokinase
VTDGGASIEMAGRVRGYVGLGANVGDARAALEGAVASLGALPGVRLAGVSRLYRTTPVGVVDQPDFLNAVVALDLPAAADATTGALDLLVALKRLERESGRQPRGRWGPRELDLDLLLYGRGTIAAERPVATVPATAAIDAGLASRLLEVPHPAMADRLFVLAPLADLAPRLVPPGWHEMVAAARRRRAQIDPPDAVIPIGRWDSRRGTWD